MKSGTNTSIIGIASDQKLIQRNHRSIIYRDLGEGKKEKHTRALNGAGQMGMR